MTCHYTRLQWKHGQPYSEQYDDVYASRDGDEAESQHVFIEANRLPQRFAEQQHVCIAETGFGTGLNFLLTVQSFLKHAAADASLDYVSVEKHLLHPDDVARCHQHRAHLKSIVDELLQHYPPAIPGMHRCMLFAGRVRLTLLLGDINEALGDLALKADAWFLDGFSPSKNRVMWSQQVYDAMAQYSHEHTTLSTYTVAGMVRRGLQQAGFMLQKDSGYGNKREMLTGKYQGEWRGAEQAPWFRLPKDAGNNKEAVVVGAGIAGLSTVWQLVQRGYRVTLVDREAKVASAASGNPAAIVMPRLAVDDDSYNAFAMQAHYFARQQYRRLQQSATEPFWFETGVLVAFETARASKLLYSIPGLSAFLTDTEQLSQQAECYWLLAADAGWLKPQVACKQILAMCDDAVRYVQAEVAAIQSDNGCHQLFDNQNHLISETSCLVLANAQGVNTLMKASDYPLQSNRGQVSLIGKSDVNIDIERPLSGGKYITPVVDGVACVGSSYAYDDTVALSSKDHIDNIDGLNGMFEKDVIKQSAKQNLQGRVSFRAVTPDRLPMVGPVPDSDYYREAYADLHHGKAAENYPAARYCNGLYINTGYGSHGFSMAFLCAEVLANIIEGTPPPVRQQMISRLLPARFLIRELKRNRLLTD